MTSDIDLLQIADRILAEYPDCVIHSAASEAYDACKRLGRPVTEWVRIGNERIAVRVFQECSSGAVPRVAPGRPSESHHDESSSGHS